MGIDYGAEVQDALNGDNSAVVVPPRWEGMPGVAFGGFAVASMFAAASARATHPRPLSMHARFHRPVAIAQPASVTVEVERRGRTVESLRVALHDQGGRLLVVGSAAFGAPTPVQARSQGASPRKPLVDPVPVAELLEGLGLPVPSLMRQVGFRRSRDLSLEQRDPDWHLHADWPAPQRSDVHSLSIAAIMSIDAFAGPATMLANGVPADRPWPVITPSLDVTAWFQDFETSSEPQSPELEGDNWLRARTSVPVTGGGYALGRTQVWSGDRLLAEGMSQIMLVPMPT